MDSIGIQLLIEIAGSLAWEFLSSIANRLRDQRLSTDERNALRRAFEVAFQRMLESFATTLPLEIQTHIGDVLKTGISNARVSEDLLNIALLRHSSVESDLYMAQLRSQFEEAGCDLNTLPIDFDKALQSFVNGLADALAEEAIPLSRLLSTVTPTLVAAHSAQVAADRRYKVLHNYLLALRAYCNQLPYVSLPGKPLPCLSDLHVEQNIELIQPQENGNLLETSRNEQAKTLKAALEFNNHILLEGGPGLGKSSSLNHLALVLLGNCLDKTEECLVPVVVSARGLSMRNCTFSEALLAQVTEQLGLRLKTPLPVDFFDRPPSSGAMWLIMVDGLDEIVALKDRNILVNAIEEHMRDSSGYRFLISTRPLPEHTRFRNVSVDRYILKPFDIQQRDSFAACWFRNRLALKDDDPQIFIKQVEEDHIADLAAVPLLLTILAVHYEQNPKQQLPSHRVNLYDSFVRLLLDVEEAERETRDAFTQEWRKFYGSWGSESAEDLFLRRRQLMEHVAFVRQNGNTRSFVDTGADFVQLSGCLRKAVEGQWLREQIEILLQRTGLIVGQGSEAVFVHHSFQEFLAACEAAKRFNPADDATWKFVKEWTSKRCWEALLFLLRIWTDNGLDVTALVRRIWHSADYLLAASAVAQGIKTSEEVERGIVASVIRRAMRLRDDSKTDQMVLRLLGELRTRQEVRTTLLNLVRNDRLSMSAIAVNAMQQLGPEDLMELSRDPQLSGFMRLRCSSVLAETGYLSEAESILLELANDRDVKVPRLHLYVEDRIPYLAARQLSELGRHDESAKILLSLVVRTKCAVTREEALKCLYALRRGDELISFALDPKIANNPSVDVSSELLTASAILIEQEKLDRAKEVLLRILFDKKAEAWTRLGALRSFWSVARNDNECLGLIRLMRDESEDGLFRSKIASRFLDNSAVSESRSTLLEIGCNLQQDPRVRFHAGQILQTAGYTDDAAAIMLSLIHDPLARMSPFSYLLCLPKPLDNIRESTKEGLRLLAVNALAPLNKADELSSVVHNAALDPLVRIRAAHVLTDSGKPDIAPVLMNLACKSTVSNDAKSEAISCLQQLNAAPELLTITRCETIDIDQRMLAARAAGSLGCIESVVPILFRIAHASRERWAVRRSAAETLSELTPTTELQSLCDRLASEETARYLSIAREPSAKKVVRRWAVDKLGRSEHVEHLTYLAEDTTINPDIRLDAAEWLKRLGREVNLVPHLFAVAGNDSDEDRYGFRNPWNAFEDLKKLCRETARNSEVPQGYVELTILATDNQFNSWTHVRAAEILMSLGYCSAAAPILYSLIMDPEQELSYRYRALEELSQYKCFHELMLVSTDSSLVWGLRVKAIEYLRLNRRTATLPELENMYSVLEQLLVAEKEGRVRGAAHDAIPQVFKCLKSLRKSQLIPTDNIDTSNLPQINRGC